MLPDRYYVADVREGSNSRRLYFYANTEGLSGPEYGYAEDSSWIDPAYESVVHEVQGRLAVQPWGYAAEPGATVSVSEPREISPEELVHQAPEVNSSVARAIRLAKEEVGVALHPIQVAWHWQIDNQARDEASIYLNLADDTGRFTQGFVMQQVRDESLMKDRIRRLYQDLLALRSKTLIMNLLRGRVGAGKD